MLRHEPKSPLRRLGRLVHAALLVGATAIPCVATAQNAGPAVQLLGMQKAPGYFRFQAQVSQGKIPVGNGVFNKVYVRLWNGGSEPVATEEQGPLAVRDGVLNLEIGQTSAGAFEQAIQRYPQLQIEICIERIDNCMSPVPIASVPYAIKASYAYNARYAQNAAHATECNFTHKAMAENEAWTGADGAGIGYLDFTSPIAPGATGTPSVLGLAIQPTTNQAGFIQWRPVDASQPEELHLCGIENGARKPLDQLVLQANMVRTSGQLVADGRVTAKAGLTVSGADLTVGTANMSGNPKAFFNGEAEFNGEVVFNKRVTFNAGAPAAGNSVSSASIINGEVRSEDIGGGQVYSTHIAAGEVKSVNIGGSQVNSAHIEDQSIKSWDIAEGAVASSEIRNGTVTAEDMAGGSVGANINSTYLSATSTTSSWVRSSASGSLLDICVVTSIIARSTTIAPGCRFVGNSGFFATFLEARAADCTAVCFR